MANNFNNISQVYSATYEHFQEVTLVLNPNNNLLSDIKQFANLKIFGNFKCHFPTDQFWQHLRRNFADYFTIFNSISSLVSIYHV